VAFVTSSNPFAKKAAKKKGAKKKKADAPKEVPTEEQIAELKKRSALKANRRPRNKGRT
jgi:ABC-type sugar transport system substrate-binding protein